MRQTVHPTPFRFNTEFEVRPVMPSIDIDEDLSAAVLRIELDALRRGQAEAVAAARAAAIAETETRLRAERDEALLSAIDALHAAWEDCAELRAQTIEDARSDAAQLALAIGEALAGHALATAPGAAIDEAIGRVLTLIARGQEVAISVNPALVEDIETRIAERQTGDRRRLHLVVEGNAAIAIGDAQLRWDGGGQSLDRDARHAAVLAELATLTQAQEPVAGDQD